MGPLLKKQWNFQRWLIQRLLTRDKKFKGGGL